MEKAIKIPIGGEKYIYGALRGSLKNPLVVFVHGLGGHKNEHIFFNGARYFEKQGFSSFRFDLYSYEKDARKLAECTLSIHGQDLDTVIGYFRNKGVKKVFAVGHSFGGPTILMSEQKDFDKAVLWDPAIEPSDFEKELKYIKSLDAYCVDWGVTVIIGRKMITEYRKIKPVKLVKNVHVPVKFIFAEKSSIKEKDRARIFESANDPKEMVVIPGANHNFDVDGTEEKLFEETYSWLKKYEPRP